MKKLSTFLSALVLSGAVLAGCGDDGGTDYEALALAFEDCSQESMANLINVLYALVSVPDSIENEDDEPFPGFRVVSALELASPPAAPNSWRFVVIFDTNGNGIPDTTVSGTAVFSESPTDGLEPGATIQITFVVDNSVLAGEPADTGTLTGSGNILATVGLIPEEVALTGTASFVDGDCTADLTFDAADPLNLVFIGFEPQLAANLGVVELFGQIQALLETLGHDFDGDLSIEEEGDTVFVVGLIDGTAEVDADFELVPSDEIGQALLGCVDTTFLWLEFFAGIYEDLANVATGNPVTGITVTPAGTNVFNYSVNLAQYDPANFTAGTLSGQATLIFPILSGASPSEVRVTWTVTNATFESGDVTNGQNATGRPLRYYFELDDPAALSGAGSFSTTVAPPPLVGTTPTMDCEVTFDIPDNDPLDIVIEGTDGTLLLTVTIDDYVMNLVVDFDAEEALVTVNGVPFPFFSF